MILGAVSGLAFGLGAGVLLQQGGLLPAGAAPAAVAAAFAAVGVLRAWALVLRSRR